MALRNVVFKQPLDDIGAAAVEKARGGIDKLIDGLTKPLTAEEQETGVKSIPRPPRIAVRGTLKEIQDYFEAHRWTDGLPIIPPTEEAVKKMLTGTSASPDKVLGLMWPEKWEATVEGVAINAVMAGCKPEYMPILLGVVEAFLKEPDMFSSEVRSTTSFAFGIIVNGPIARKIGMNSGIGALGPGNPANASIGRALRLFIMNLGGSWPGISDMGSQGNVARYSFAFAENEEESPWEPFHVERGFKADQSVVSVFSGRMFIGPFGALQGIVDGLRNQAGSVLEAGVLVDPLLAKAIAKQFPKKSDFKNYLYNNATEPLATFKARSAGQLQVRIGKPGWWPEWYNDPKTPKDKIVPVYGSPERIHVIVVGGGSSALYQAWELRWPTSVAVDKWR
jgi:hypothetical protein